MDWKELGVGVAIVLIALVLWDAFVAALLGFSEA
jgi:archaellin